MRRLALLSTAALGLAVGATACGSPVEPGTSTASADAAPSLGKRPSPTPTPTPTTNCASLVYPSSLCAPVDLQMQPGQREALCAALRYGGTFYHPVVGRPATETFARNGANTGSVETVVIPRGYKYPPTILTYKISDVQTESAGMCLGVVTSPPA